jgi:putative transposase
MHDWPHAPSHRLGSAGAYIVTAGTYRKEPLFRSREHLDFLLRQLFECATEHGAALQAWSVFPNHYHFVAAFRDSKTVSTMVRSFHSITARHLNQADKAPGRRVWYQYWDSHITFQSSYYARLRYVHENAVHHRLVPHASNYRWGSAAWLERNCAPAFRKTVLSFPCDRISISDEYEVAETDFEESCD